MTEKFDLDKHVLARKPNDSFKSSRSDLFIQHALGLNVDPPVVETDQQAHEEILLPLDEHHTTSRSALRFINSTSKPPSWKGKGFGTVSDRKAVVRAGMDLGRKTTPDALQRLRARA